MSQTKMVRVEVTAEHIATGEVENCWRCPVALAFMGVLDSAFRPSVGEDYLTIVHDTKLGLVHSGMALPTRVREHIALFDGGFGMRPFAFEIALPVQVLAEAADA